MKWTCALQTGDDGGSLADVLTACAGRVRDDLAGARPDLVLVFVSPHFAGSYGEVPAIIRRILEPAAVAGCSAGGLIGGGREVEGKPAVGLAAALLPGVEVRVVHITDGDLPDMDAPPAAWEEAFGVSQASEPAFLLLPDPFTLHIDALVAGLDYAYPKAVKIGGLASGATRPGLNALFLSDRIEGKGAVAVALSGNIVVDGVVAQGCRPVGRTMRISRCDRNFLFELDGQPAINCLHETLTGMSERDRALARHSLFIGVLMDEFKENPEPGDFLIRNILGMDPQSGALVVGESLREERTVQFHLRDAATSADDLRLMLKGYADGHKEAVCGALLFSCLGRGEHLYGRANHDSECFFDYFGDVPLAGFFCNGEIGPVAGSTFLHGYTSSFGMFRARERSPAGLPGC